MPFKFPIHLWLMGIIFLSVSLAQESKSSSLTPGKRARQGCSHHQ